MAKYQLRLIEIPEDARASVVDTGRSAGPPLNRRKFNAALMGTEPLPAIVAESDIRGPISGLRQLLADAGCQIELIEDRAELSLSDKLAQLKRQFDGLNARERYAAMGVAALFSIAMVMLLGFAIFGGEDEKALNSSNAQKLNVKTSSDTFAQIRANSEKAAQAVKPTPYKDVFGKLPKLDAPCENPDKNFSCMLHAFRQLTKTSSLTPRKPNGAQSISSVDYLKVVHFRFFRCLAEELSRNQEGDKELASLVIDNLGRSLVYRYGRSNCDRDRTSMYNCTKEARQMSCEALYHQLNGAWIEFHNQEETQEWTGQFADYYGNKLLNCLSEEQKRDVTPTERAVIHLYRYRIANAVEKVENTCQEEEYVACSKSFYDKDCDQVTSLIETDADQLVYKMTQHCDVLQECR